MKFEKRSEIPVRAKELFQWHSRPGAFGRLAPPWQEMEVLREDPGLAEGKEVEIRIDTPSGKRLWKAKHISCVDGKEFTDTQVQGPLKSWTHRHQFLDKGDSTCEMVDSIEYELPLGLLGSMVGGGVVSSELEKSFDYRHWIVGEDFKLKASLPRFRPLKVLLAGGSGFLGTKLNHLLSSQGHEVLVLTRSKRKASEVEWDPAKGELDAEKLEGVDAVINLAGESLVDGRWNDEKKERLRSSRIGPTRLLVDTFRKMDRAPSVFLSGSAIGYYGDDPEKPFPETAERGEGFLAELCEAWEEAALEAESLGIRVGLLRTGIVVDPRGGALQKMMPAFRFGVGGPLGDGQQWFPWVTLEDWIRAVNWLLFDEAVAGPVNLVAPGLVRQRDFAKALGDALKRPSVLPAPKAALSLVFGEMADQALLASTRAVPEVLGGSGFPFALPELPEALHRIL